MKTILSLLVLFVALEVRSQNIGDCQKVGYADTGYIVRNLPEISQIEAELKSIGGQYEKQLNSKYQEYSAKVNGYREKSLSEEERSNSEAELIRLRKSIEKFEHDAEGSFRKRQAELMAPIYLKVDRSINEVAAENNYNVIINSESGDGEKILLFFDNKFDISPLVLKKLGVNVNANRRP
ncbi:MAG: OmpH family outer membrane protein [Chryseolinea sp.]